ncbi:hypothetical protein SSPO_079070 [Streptomyces antimycoticus]|uniref:Uncharacterized protein n=1 Tax=Streptomyces antimycoticus TaxID=68175 RepID=A0A499V890_9ACTN|nr:hypothetical protein SSPO_079070 [Streptomyces antimycoticus]
MGRPDSGGRPSGGRLIAEGEQVRAAAVRQRMENARLRHHEWIRVHGPDLPEAAGWSWTGEAYPALVEGRRHPWLRFRCPEYGAAWYAGDSPLGNRKRSDRRYCSPRCRTRVWRRRSRSAGVTV